MCDICDWYIWGGGARALGCLLLYRPRQYLHAPTYHFIRVTALVLTAYVPVRGILCPNTAPTICDFFFVQTWTFSSYMSWMHIFHVTITFACTKLTTLGELSILLSLLKMPTGFLCWWEVRFSHIHNQNIVTILLTRLRQVNSHGLGSSLEWLFIFSAFLCLNLLR